MRRVSSQQISAADASASIAPRRQVAEVADRRRHDDETGSDWPAHSPSRTSTTSPTDKPHRSNAPVAASMTQLPALDRGTQPPRAHAHDLDHDAASSTKATSIAKRMPNVCTQRHDVITSAPSMPSRPRRPRRRSGRSSATSADARTRASLTNHATPPGWHARPRSSRPRTVPYSAAAARQGESSGRQHPRYSGPPRRGPQVHHDRRPLRRRPAHRRRRAVRRRGGRPLRALGGRPRSDHGDRHRRGDGRCPT